jgi:RimJ/RimL family protein N-acetyltransferase
MFIQSEAVGRSEHESWLSASLKSAVRLLLIAEHDGRKVGTIRFDDTQEHSELSWTISPQERGQGLGTAMLALALTSFPRDRFIAKIKPENLASSAMVRKCGFINGQIESGLDVWTRTCGGHRG